MKKLTYLAVFEPTGNGAFSVYFPQFPGCITCGENYEAAYKNATVALGMHLYSMYKDGDQISKANFDIEVDPDTQPGYLLTPISIYPKLIKNELDNKAVKTNITLPQWLKDWAVSENINLSQTLQTVLKDMYNTSKESLTMIQD